MLLTVSKKMQFAASFKYHDQPNDRSAIHAANFNAYFVFAGPIDNRTGMMINVTTIKDHIGALLERRYDHRCLTVDTPPFDQLAPTVENIARQLLLDAAPLFDNNSASLVACHLSETDDNEATAYADGRVERHYWLSFSAARRTFSPHLSDQENRELFGVAAAPSGHGHYYRLRVTTISDPDSNDNVNRPSAIIVPVLKELHDLLDHKNLNSDVKELQGLPMTTECLSGWLFDHLNSSTPINRVALWENPFFSVECLGPDKFAMSIRTSFQAAHRLHSPHLSDRENLAIYGKCNNPAGHGHRYRVETTIAGKLDRTTGTLLPLEKLQSSVKQALKPWDYRFLDQDTTDFDNNPSTSENIIQLLQPRIESEIEQPLSRLRLWETDNNRFTLRRT